MIKNDYFKFLIYLIVLTVIVNGFALIYFYPLIAIPLFFIFLFINVLAGTNSNKTKNLRLKYCYHGAYLLFLFQISTLISILYHICLVFFVIPEKWWILILSMIFCYLLEFIIFWNGIICVYVTSVQLGLKQRFLGILCGNIPILNLICLNFILKTVFKEVKFETEKEKINAERKDSKICETKYPCLLVHGVFFRDAKHFNYWGRIPKELEKNGAKIYYGNHESAASVYDSAVELAEKIKEIVSWCGCEKVNIIAHSKGGLDCRYAISELDIAPYVASLTTINTPHRGCSFADFLLYKSSEKLKNKVANTYNSSFKKLGDKKPDFLAAVNNLTQSYCEDFNKRIHTPENIFCQSVGSKVKKATSGKFPLNFSYHLVKLFDGANDGLVSEKSFAWGEKYTFIESNGTKGVSHGDMIDLNRRNFDGFDVREFYVNLVNDLKNRGL